MPRAPPHRIGTDVDYLSSRPGRGRRVPDGHPQVATRLDAESLAGMRRALQTEVHASSALARGVPEREQLLRDTGQALFSALLSADGIVGCW